MSINAQDVMALRQRTGLGMMDCKHALMDSDGDAAAAEEMLRQRLKGKMDTRTERAAAEGRLAIAIADDRSAAAMVELNTETDFTARNDLFVQSCAEIARLALGENAGTMSITDAMTQIVDNLRIKTGENVSIRRGVKLAGEFCGSYLHHDGKKGVIVQLSASVDEQTLTGICQHITAHVPIAVGVDQSDIPAECLDRVRSEGRRMAVEDGKPEEIVEKIAEGRLRKYLADVTLLDQKYVKDPQGKKTVRQILPDDVTVQSFVRYVIGLD